MCVCVVGVNIQRWRECLTSRGGEGPVTEFVIIFICTASSFLLPTTHTIHQIRGVILKNTLFRGVGYETVINSSRGNIYVKYRKHRW